MKKELQQSIRLYQFPKIVSLIVEYDNEFRRIKDNLMKINSATELRRMSPALLDIANQDLWLEPASEWSRLHKCAYSYDTENKNFESSFWFSMPISTRNSRIMEADAFRFWNLTDTNNLCLQRYVGPKYILANLTNGCYLHVYEYWIRDSMLKGQACVEPGAKVKFNGRLFVSEECKTQPDYSQSVQIKEVEEYNVIYCTGNNITIQNKTLACPKEVFRISVSEPFTINSYEHQVTNIDSVIINPLIKRLHEDITDQLELNKQTIRSANYTKTDSTFKEYRKLLEKYTQNLTHLLRSERLDEQNGIAKRRQLL